MKRARTFDLFAINAYWFGLSILWNSLHVIILPAVLLNYVPETHKNTYLGLMTFVGLIIAMIVQPISGSLSDRWRSRWGRRRPLIALGTALDFIFLAILGWAGGLLWLAIGYIGLQFTSNIAHGPAQGLIPDRVPPEQHGAASGVKNLLDMGGLVVASLVMGNLLDPQAPNALIPLGVVAAVLSISALSTLLGVREVPSQGLAVVGSTSLQPPAAARDWLASSRKSPYAWLIGSRFLFLLGIYDIQVFAQYYIRDVIPTDNPIKLTGDLLASITLALIVCALAGGWIGDRIGHKRVQYAASGIGALGCLLLLMAKDANSLLVFGGVTGVGIGLFITANWALLSRMAPLTQAGAYLGLTNLATAGSGALGRLMGPVIDGLNNANPGAYNGYTAMFIFGAVCTGLSTLLLVKVPEKRQRIFPSKDG
ncbi:MAG: MFS transporter [Anaerolineales bacterium]|nr:MFS transporter [Anaerolineales bacterium]